MKPWYNVIPPREDLRENRPLDASVFAVHLDQVRDGKAPEVYQKPEDFFDRTFLTQNLSALVVEVIRRLNGIQVETSPVFNLTTQFGGGKTHALTLLYHLARGGAAIRSWKGVPALLDRAQVDRVPVAATAVFVGTEFDSLTGRGGIDGTPLRKTPWGEVAWQLAQRDVERYRLIEEHEKNATAPGGDVLARLLPPDRPSLLLFDELMNYVSRNRKSGLAGQLYSFLHNLSEVVRSRADTVLAVSIPASELEMTAEDQTDYERLKKLVDRVGKSVFMSSETETSEIIRRRLFEWQGPPPEASKTVREFADWVAEHRLQVPSWFPVDTARDTFAATYPFHPSVISVFERKWRGLPQFQQTRGMLRLLALWVAHACHEGYKGLHKDPLITLGTAPLESSLFRAAVFDQLGESRLEAAVTTDIAGREHAHALRLDSEGTTEVRKARLHRKVATAIFFESNGGQQKGEATQPEIQLAVAEPDLDIGNVEQCLEALTETCYYLVAQKNRYHFSFKPNLNKLLADRRASVPAAAVRERVRTEVTKVFSQGGNKPLAFPEKSGDIPDQPALTLVVLDPEAAAEDGATQNQILAMTRDHGASSRTFKSALLWCVAEEATKPAEAARKLLAWQDIESDREILRIDEEQLRHLQSQLGSAQRDLREAVWRSYRNVFILDSDNTLRRIDLGMVNSSSSPDGTLFGLILSRLQQADLVVDSVSPSFLARNWATALPEWSTRAIRDAFYASPKLPRLLKADSLRETMSRGVGEGFFAYVAKRPDGEYEPFVFKSMLPSGDVEISNEVFLIRKDAAEAYLAGRSRPLEPQEGSAVPQPQPEPAGPRPVETPAAPAPTAVPGFRWHGNLDARKWMNFYTKVLTPFATSGGVRLTLEVDIHPPGGVSPSRIEEVKMGLRELGLKEEIEVKVSGGEEGAPH